ncbi:hypothetical protein PSD17_24650 [Pseudonocardia sp. D17]|nr:hypothetical protein PSD17_24650 [Pseudonocardia sp. D17]
MPDLADGHDVQAAVELAVPGSGQAVADGVAGGDLNGRGAGIGGEGCRRTEPAYVPDSSEDLAGGQITEAAKLGESAAAGRNGSADLGRRGGDPSVQVTDFADEVDSQVLRSMRGPGVRGRTVRSARAAVSASSELDTPPGSSLASSA